MSDPFAEFESHAAAIRAARPEERRRARSRACAFRTANMRAFRFDERLAAARKELALVTRRVKRYAELAAAARRRAANFREEAPPSVDANGWPIPPVRPTRAQLAQRARRLRESQTKQTARLSVPVGGEAAARAPDPLI